MTERIADGDLVGNPDGGADLTTLGSLESNSVGEEESYLEGKCDGEIVGVTDTTVVGTKDGLSDFIEGSPEGKTEIILEGANESCFEGM